MPSVLGRGAVRSRVVVTLRRGSRLRRDDLARVDRPELTAVSCICFRCGLVVQ